MKILVIEDDADVAFFLCKGLREEGHAVVLATTASEGLEAATADRFDVLIVDRMLPDQADGIVIVETLRRVGNSVPVLFLSALDKVDERIRGLRAGGDDYLTKPFSFAELTARLDGLGRRTGAVSDQTILRVADLELDLLSRRARRGGVEIELLPREFKLLEFMMRRAGQVVTRAMLLDGLWNYQFDPQTNVIDVHIGRLRRKVDTGFAKPLIRTVRNAGYVVRDDG